MLQVTNHFFKYYIPKISFEKFYLTLKNETVIFQENLTVNYFKNFMTNF